MRPHIVKATFDDVSIAVSILKKDNKAYLFRRLASQFADLFKPIFLTKTVYKLLSIPSSTNTVPVHLKTTMRFSILAFVTMTTNAFLAAAAGGICDGLRDECTQSCTGKKITPRGEWERQVEPGRGAQQKRFRKPCNCIEMRQLAVQKALVKARLAGRNKQDKMATMSAGLEPGSWPANSLGGK
ncbi:hypothetical protein MCOR10_001025 [Pyricularia oryzae]|nr:hypothetical protein MCOR10_001025 [Pyricularia oryzae]